MNKITKFKTKIKMKNQETTKKNEKSEKSTKKKKNHNIKFVNIFIFCFYQMGYLDVVIPPNIINEDTSGDVMVPEGGTVKLTCRAKGYPKPHVLWRREDGREIVIKDASSTQTKGQSICLSCFLKYFFYIICLQLLR